MLEVANLCKTFAVPVLKNVSLSFDAGSVHALMGPNGAGKSTLCNIINGVVPKTSGTLTLGDNPYTPHSPRDAESAGIRMVRQELHLIENLTVAENICLTDLPHRMGIIRRAEVLERAHAALQQVGIKDIDPRVRLGELGVGHQQLVEITRALSIPSRLVILDEPTAALSQPQVRLLFDYLESLKARGCAVIYISHRMSEIEAVSDHISVLRDGEVVTSQPASSITQRQIISMMAGNTDLPTGSGQPPPSEAPTVLKLDKLCSGNQVRNVDLELKQGELLGIAGLIGSGRTHLLRTLFGCEPVTAGDIAVNQQRATFRTPTDAVEAGLSFAPEDRRKHGLLLELSVTQNLTLGKVSGLAGRTGVLSKGVETAAAQQLCKSMSVECHSLSQPVAELSGGNQQKVVLGRCLSRPCSVALFDEPTRGVDIAAKQQIHAQLRKLAASGVGVVVVSSDTEELMSICDRITVMSNGEMVNSFERGAWTSERLMAAALSGYDRAREA